MKKLQFTWREITVSTLLTGLAAFATSFLCAGVLAGCGTENADEPTEEFFYRLCVNHTDKPEEYTFITRQGHRVGRAILKPELGNKSCATRSAGRIIGRWPITVTPQMSTRDVSDMIIEYQQIRPDGKITLGTMPTSKSSDGSFKFWLSTTDNDDQQNIRVAITTAAELEKASRNATSSVRPIVESDERQKKVAQKRLSNTTRNPNCKTDSVKWQFPVNGISRVNMQMTFAGGDSNYLKKVSDYLLLDVCESIPTATVYSSKMSCTIQEAERNYPKQVQRLRLAIANLINHANPSTIQLRLGGHLINNNCRPVMVAQE